MINYFAMRSVKRQRHVRMVLKIKIDKTGVEI